jgi:hypothetical protein
MTYLPSLPKDAVLLDVFRAYPHTSRGLPPGAGVSLLTPACWPGVLRR